MTVRRGARWLLATAGAILLLFAAGGYSVLEVTTVTIRNDSAVPLTDVKCAFNGRGFCPADVAPGGSRIAFAVLQTEDPMTFSFRAGNSEKQVMFGYPMPEPADSYEIAVAKDMAITRRVFHRISGGSFTFSAPSDGPR